MNLNSLIFFFFITSHNLMSDKIKFLIIFSLYLQLNKRKEKKIRPKKEKNSGGVIPDYTITLFRQISFLVS